MANAFYDHALQSFAAGEIAWLTDNIKVAAVRTGGGHYVVNLATDQFLSAIAGADIVSTTANLGSKTDTAGVLDAADTAFVAVSGSTIGALVIYQDTGVAGTSRLIMYIDTGAGIPAVPTGADINLAWSNDANKIGKI